MNYLRAIIAGLALTSLLAAASCTTKDPLSPPGTGGTAPRDTVWLTTDTVSAGDTAIVLLSLTNLDSSIASLNIWLRSSSPGVTFDTMNVTSPRFPVTGMEWIAGRADSVNIVSILAVDFQGTAVIPPGSGSIMSIRYAVDPGQLPGTYTIDTSSIILLSSTDPLDIAYPSGTTSPVAAFVRGAIVVQ